jgi:hypothetical protein
MTRRVIIDNLLGGFFDAVLDWLMQLFVDPQERRCVFDFHRLKRVEIMLGRLRVLKRLPTLGVGELLQFS